MPLVRLFRSMMSCFRSPFFQKCTERPQMTLAWSRSKDQYACYKHPEAHFRPFCSMISHFGLRPSFWKSAPNDLDMFKVKNMDATYTPEAHIFISSLYDKPFLGYSSMFAKMHRMAPNDFDMFKVKNTNMHATYTPKAQLFVCFPLRWAIFELRPFSWKCTKWPRLVQGRKYQHACYIHPRGPNFQPFRSTMSRFWVTAQFSGTALNDPKWPS